ISASCPIVVDSPNIQVYELANAMPLAFVADDPKHSLPMFSNGGGIEIDTRSLHAQTNVVVNVLAAQSLNAYAGWRYLPATTDGWGRMVLLLPKDIQRLQILYRPPWLIGTACGIALAASAVVLMRLRNPRASVNIASGVNFPTQGTNSLRPAA